jgi:hypothetical protein
VFRDVRQIAPEAQYDSANRDGVGQKLTVFVTLITWDSIMRRSSTGIRFVLQIGSSPSAPFCAWS